MATPASLMCLPMWQWAKMVEVSVAATVEHAVEAARAATAMVAATVGVARGRAA